MGQNFPQETWNVYNRGMSTRTNNFVESYHGRWNKKVGVQHPSIWTFVAKMQDQHARACVCVRACVRACLCVSVCVCVLLKFVTNIQRIGI